MKRNRPCSHESSRRSFLKKLFCLAGSSLIYPEWVFALEAPALTRPILSSGETIPVIGMGSSRTFDVDDDMQARAIRTRVLRTFFEMGGAMIDSSPMYGSSEEVIGYCLKQLPDHASLFSATKVWTLGRELGIKQMHNSAQLWGTDPFDLMQIHNLVHWEIHIETLKQWKQEGKIRYIGITTSHGRRHQQLEQALLKEDFDFVQFSYNILNREVEQRLLPIAAEKGIAVIANRPFQRGRLFDLAKGKPLPDWAREFDAHNWAQFFLKFIVSHPHITCAIPATSRVDHMQENMGALFGALPGMKTRQKMIKYFKSVI